MTKKKKTLIIIMLLISVIQFIPIDRSKPEIDQKNDLLTITKPSKEIEEILSSSCYDCHSNQTTYPWYTNIAPMSWWIQNHINEGKGHLNFSYWGEYEEKKKLHKLDECVEMIEDREMPLSSYTWLYHKEANLSDEQRNQLVNWFNSIR